MIEEENESNKNSYFVLKLLLFCFIVFLIIYISKETGMYEFKNYTKTHLTEDAIKQFEKDLDEGKNVTLKDYIINDKKNYINIVNKTGSFLSTSVEEIMNDGIKKITKIFSKLFYEQSG